MQSNGNQHREALFQIRHDKTEKKLGIINGITYSLAGWIVGAFVAAAGATSYGVIIVLLSPILGAALTAATLCANREKYKLRNGLLFYFVSTAVFEVFLIAILYYIVV